MNTINGTSYLTNFGNNLYELLNSISDPTGEYKRKFVYRDMPDVKSVEFDGYPFVILSDYGVTDVSWTMDRSVVNFTGSAEIHIFNSNSSAEDKIQFDELSQSVLNELLTNQDLNNAKIINPRIERNQRFPSRDESEEKVLVREIVFECDMQVTIQ